MLNMLLYNMLPCVPVVPPPIQMSGDIRVSHTDRLCLVLDFIIWLLSSGAVCSWAEGLCLSRCSGFNWFVPNLTPPTPPPPRAERLFFLQGEGSDLRERGT